jgi:hypothetical protein
MSERRGDRVHATTSHRVHYYVHCMQRTDMYSTTTGIIMRGII